MGDTAQRYQEERKNGVHGSLPDELLAEERKVSTSVRTKASWDNRRSGMVASQLIMHARCEGSPCPLFETSSLRNEHW